MCLNKTKLIKSHYKLVVVIASIYIFVNYLSTKRRGRPLYWFLTWDDWKSPVIALVLIGSASFIFYSLAFLDEKLTEMIHGQFKEYKEIVDTKRHEKFSKDDKENEKILEFAQT